MSIKNLKVISNYFIIFNQNFLYTQKNLRQLLTSFERLRVYVRDTKITNEELSNLTQIFTKAEIISEFRFEKVEPAKSVFRQVLQE